MQLLLTRTQREAGVMSKSVLFCLDARVEFTPAEKQNIARYRMQNEVIYSSDGAKRAAEAAQLSAARFSGGQLNVDSLGGAAGSIASTMGSGLKAIAMTAIAGMKLNITIASLERGQHIECKSLDELLGAEDAILTACQNLRTYLDTAATFDGTRQVIDFPAGGQVQLVAQASPQAQIVMPPVGEGPQIPPASGMPPPQAAYVPPPGPPPTYQSAAYEPGKSYKDIAAEASWMEPDAKKAMIVSVAIGAFMLVLWLLIGHH